MSISPKFIQGELVNKIQKLTKGKIWEYSNGTPAVFKSNAFQGKSPPSPKMPYITVDFAQTLNPFLREKFEGWISETKYALLETKIMQFVITVYGAGDDDTLQIASELSSRLKLSHNRAHFHQFEVLFFDVTRPVPSSTRITDQYRDMTRFNISFSYVERVVDSAGSEIYTGGGLYSGSSIYTGSGAVGSAITTVNINTDLNKNPDGKGGLYKGEDDTTPLPIQTGDLPPS